MSKISKKKLRHYLKNTFFVCISLGFIGGGALLLWASTFSLPSYEAMQDRKVSESTKIYDRTGQVVLYDIHQNIQRTIVPLDKIAPSARNASIAIEDGNFYHNIGIEPLSIIRAVVADIFSGGYGQGGSTITQQVVKNALLTPQKTISRKIKEWVLAIKLTQALTKDQILSLYLNEVPYGGNIYGIEEASLSFFGKHASDLTLTEAAYLAALPQAPTYYSPYGQHRQALEDRKNLVLKRMLDLGFISKDAYTKAVGETVTFLPEQTFGIKAPHFVMWVKQYLEKKYGRDEVENGGLKVITTLDYDLQAKAEQLVAQYAADNTVKFNATNAGAVGIDPKTGQVLMMVGSKDYFDTKAEGNFNVTLAHRQPGSTFKPFVYATAFEKGYTPNTELFDVPTQFQVTCDAEGKPLLPTASTSDCYMPVNFDGKFVGPITMAEALAQSRNVPAIKTLYLAGLQDSLNTAKSMGITSLGNVNQYGLTLVLGGGEVSLLDMTSAYGVFANDGVRNPYTSILEVDDRDGNVLEKYTPHPQNVLNKNIALQISSILSSDPLRAPELGVHSPLYFPGKDVAAKTGTTNDFRDAWTIGYTPSFVLGTWVGNNDNTPMIKKIAGFVVAPLWHAIFDAALANLPDEKFEAPLPEPKDLKPVLRGIWKGDQTYYIDHASGKLATQYTPQEMKVEQVLTNVHSILYWVDKKNPRGPIPTHPETDDQFSLWEPPVQKWATDHHLVTQTTADIPTATDDVHGPQFAPHVQITSPAAGVSIGKSSQVVVTINATGSFPIQRADLFVNGALVGSTQNTPLSFSFIPENIPSIAQNDTLTVIVYDSVLNKSVAKTTFSVTGL